MQSIVFAAVLAFGATLPALTAAQFNETQIDDATKEGWCNAQVAQCPALCADQDLGTQENECFPDNLFYMCVCDDGSRPNLTEYSETIPYYICVLDQQECIKDCGAGGNSCAEQCRKTHVCGATNPKKSNKTTSATTSSGNSATTTSGAVRTDENGFLTTSAPDENDGEDDKDSGAGAIFLKVGGAYGIGIVAAGIALGAVSIGL